MSGIGRRSLADPDAVPGKWDPVEVAAEFRRLFPGEETGG